MDFASRDNSRRIKLSIPFNDASVYSLEILFLNS